MVKKLAGKSHYEKVYFFVMAFLTFNALCMLSYLVNRVGKSHLLLLAARPVRRLSGIFPLHGSAHKQNLQTLMFTGFTKLKALS